MHEPRANPDSSPRAATAPSASRRQATVPAARQVRVSGAATRNLTAGDANGDPAPPGNGPLTSPEATTRAGREAVASRDEYPCLCKVLLQSDIGPRLTFVFTALAHGRVLATIDELPAVWAIGETVPAARAALFVEVALLLAANRANAVPLGERFRLLKRETVILAARRPS